jgi:pyruvate/2-oxoglutarate/acetoin dehydrogenase E1 component
MERSLSFIEAICEATHQEMEIDPSVIVMGLGVNDPKAILGSTQGIAEKFGPERIFDTPLAEDGMTGVAIGMALAGLRPIHVHIRMDFLMLAMNQLINVAAKTHYMYGGQESVPLVVRAIIGKSWGQGAQHSQALYSYFMHVPGLKVVVPTTPYDAKGCLIQAIRDNNPVIFIEHRLLHFQKCPVPEPSYAIPPGKARIAVEGKDITLIGISYMQLECLRAQKYLEGVGISAEVIDPIWISPLDIKTIVNSVRKTKRLLVADNAWLTCGASAEIVTQVVESIQGTCDIQVKRMGFAPAPCPTTPTLEDQFYPNARQVASEVHKMVFPDAPLWIPDYRDDLKAIEFKGPF